ncbi:MAG: Na/Pi cotransporter family protein [Candidatus Methanomethylophilaceae archaeon]|nr:Na/Pi cotransporter family protein [Candidatus Methanomethylophilaceae archaeon]
MNKEIARFLVKLSENQLSERDQIYVSTVYHTISDLERIGDYSKNIMEYAQKLKEQGTTFSEVALKETMIMESLIEQLYEKIEIAYTETSEIALEAAYDIEENIDIVTESMAQNHVERLNEGVCKLDVGSEFLAMTSDSERVADHLINMGKVIRLYS